MASNNALYCAKARENLQVHNRLCKERFTPSHRVFFRDSIPIAERGHDEVPNHGLAIADLRHSCQRMRNGRHLTGGNPTNVPIRVIYSSAVSKDCEMARAAKEICGICCGSNRHESFTNSPSFDFVAETVIEFPGTCTNGPLPISLRNVEVYPFPRLIGSDDRNRYCLQFEP